MKRLLILLLLAAPLQAAPKVTIRTTTGECGQIAQWTEDILHTLRDIPSATIFIVCNGETWRTFALRQGFSTSVAAVSNWKNGQIFINASDPKIRENSLLLRQAIEHEFEHLRCRCPLGEH